MRIHRTGRNGTNGHVNPAAKTIRKAYYSAYFYFLFCSPLQPKDMRTVDEKGRPVSRTSSMTKRVPASILVDPAQYSKTSYQEQTAKDAASAKQETDNKKQICVC
jgi:hypothetical protein